MKKISLIIALFVGMIFFSSQDVHAERPLYDKYPSGYSNSNSAFFTYTQGYRFTPSQNGEISQLWCYRGGTRKVSLWEDGNTTPLATANVTCNSNWGSEDITPVPVTSGTYYRVGVYTPTYTTYYRRDAIPLPYTQGNITVSHAIYGSGDGYPNTSQSDLTGLADVTFEVKNPPTVLTRTAASIAATQASLRSRVNPNGVSTTVYFRYGTTNTSCESLPTVVTQGNIGSGTSNVSGQEVVTNLSPQTTYYFCAYATNSDGTTYGSVRDFTTEADPPTVTTQSVTGIGTDEATLRSSVNPNGLSTTVYYRYGTTNTSCASLSTSTTYGGIGSGTSDVSYNPKTITELSSNTTYYYCAYATNSVGTTYGEVLSFTTEAAEPSVTTSAVSTIGQISAKLNGMGNPNGYATIGWFRYYSSNPGSCSDSGGTRIPASSGSSLGSGTTDVSFSQDISGLTPNTTYYACAFASNTHGTGSGNVRSFTTSAGTPLSVSASGESSLGSYSVTLNGSANPNNFASYGFFRLYTSDPGSCIDSGGKRFPSAQQDDASLGSGGSGVNFSYDVSDIDPDASHYYCAFARNAYGTVASSVDTFTTVDGPSGPCDPPAGGDHSITISCNYEGENTGVDEGDGTRNTGTIQVESNRILTINPGQTVAWGVLGAGRGGYITVSPAGSLRSGAIWVIDADGDGYIANSEQYVGAQPEGGARRNTISTNYNYYSRIVNNPVLDCDDNAYSLTNSCAEIVLAGSLIDSTNLDGANDVVASGSYAYVTSLNSQSLSVIDISNPANPTIVGSMTDPTLWPDGLAVSGNYAYVAGRTSDSLSVINISNPANPTIVGSVADSTRLDFANSVYVSGNYAYMTAQGSDSLVVIDISNPANPTIVGSVIDSTNLNAPSNVVVSGNYAYVISMNSSNLSIIDISNPASPSIVSADAMPSIGLGFQNLHIDGNYLYLGEYLVGDFIIADISNPTSPVKVSEIPSSNFGSGGGVTSIYTSGNYAYIASSSSDSLILIDITNPASPVVKDSYTDSTNMNGPQVVHVSGGYAYVAAIFSDSLTILGISGL